MLTACVGVLTWAGTASPARAEAKAAKIYEVHVVKDLVYRDLLDGEDAKLDKNKLDLYLPKGLKDFPVLFFVHGGAWRNGHKNFLGMYNSLGQFWARRGIATVVTNYRLSPAHKHPAHIEDVARAYAWTYKNIAKHGGRADQIFACGHSAGGHLVALLATDERYLKSEGLTLGSIRGVIPISGVYTLAVEHSLFKIAFGNDPAVGKSAAPHTHVGSGKHPPFLVVYADHDFPTCDKMSEAFCQALQKCQCSAEALCVKDRNHISVLFYVTYDNDPVGKAMLKFIETYTTK